MLKLFERNTVFQIVVILVVTTLLWLPHLAAPQPMTEPSAFAPLYGLLYSLSLSPLAAVIIAIVLVIVGGILLNLMLANAGLVSQNSLLPTFFYILFMSATADTLSPTLIVGIVAIAFVNMLLIHSTLLTIPSSKIFGATALIGICSLFYLPSLMLLIAYLLVAISYRLYGWRDWMVLLLGLLAPYVLLWIILYMNGTLAESFPAMAAVLTPPHLATVNFQFSLSLVANAILLLVFLVSLFVHWRRFGERTTHWQKNATAVVMPTVAALGLLLYNPTLPVNLQFLAIPFAFCATVRFTLNTQHSSFSARHSFRHQWRSHLKDLLFVIVIVAAIVC